jgi:rhodanese-related sulfurtransferase
MKPKPISRAKIALLLGAVSLLFIAPFVVPLRAGSTPSVASEKPIEVVGASVLLRMQREGAPVYDFRRDGQTIPGARRTQEDSFNQNDFSNARSLVLIGDETQLGKLARTLQTQENAPQIYIVPKNKVAAYPDFAGVRQIEPRAFFEKQNQNAARKIPIFDFAESEEFAFARVAGSTRVPWTKFISGDRSFLKTENGARLQTIALICPVGSRSQIAAQQLQREGVRVLNIRGGMFAWQNAGLPIDGELQNANRSTPNAD